MPSPIRRMKRSGYVSQEVGEVSVAEPSGWTVATDDGEYRAARALSSLVAPERDDQVLLALAEDGRAWILAVLERRPGAAVRMEIDGDLSLRLPAGRFSVAAQEGLDLFTAKDASVVAGTVKITGAEGVVHIDRLSYLGRWVQGEVERIKLFAGSIDSVADRFWQRVKRSFRFVEEMDHVQAEEIRYRARNNAQIQGRNMLVTGEQLVKVDADQIHLG